MSSPSFLVCPQPSGLQLSQLSASLGFAFLTAFLVFSGGALAAWAVVLLSVVAFVLLLLASLRFCLSSCLGARFHLGFAAGSLACSRCLCLGFLTGLVCLPSSCLMVLVLRLPFCFLAWGPARFRIQSCRLLVQGSPSVTPTTCHAAVPHSVPARSS